MYEDLRKIQEAEIDDKTVVVRVNFDVPTDGTEIFDNTRIKASQKTIEYLLSKNCKIVLISHLGRPHGEETDKLSLMDARFELGTILSKPVKFAHIGACENSIKFMEKGEILLLENLRFSPAETSSDSKEREEFIKPLAEMCDIYINDAFGVYREHASVLELAQLLPSFAGFNLQDELTALDKFKEDMKSPFVLILGGSKMDTKIPLIESYADKVDKLIIGGAMAYTFLKAQGVEIGMSRVEDEKVKEAKKILDIAKKAKVEVYLPVDHIAGKEFDKDTTPIDVDTQQIPKDLRGLDIGPKTLAIFREIIESSQTILWTGPMGVFEWENFNRGTESIGEYIALAAPREAYKVAGGADTTYAINSLKIKAKRFNHVSIGGGMMLKYLTGETFSVINALSGKQE